MRNGALPCPPLSLWCISRVAPQFTPRATCYSARLSAKLQFRPPEPLDTNARPGSDRVYHEWRAANCQLQLQSRPQAAWNFCILSFISFILSFISFQLAFICVQ
jgi:hypothetical protein